MFFVTAGAEFHFADDLDCIVFVFFIWFKVMHLSTGSSARCWWSLLRATVSTEGTSLTTGVTVLSIRRTLPWRMRCATVTCTCLAGLMTCDSNHSAICGGSHLGHLHGLCHNHGQLPDHGLYQVWISWRHPHSHCHSCYCASYGLSFSVWIWASIYLALSRQSVRLLFFVTSFQELILDAFMTIVN